MLRSGRGIKAIKVECVYSGGLCHVCASKKKATSTDGFDWEKENPALRPGQMSMISECFGLSLAFSQDCVRRRLYLLSMRLDSSSSRRASVDPIPKGLAATDALYWRSASSL